MGDRPNQLPWIRPAAPTIYTFDKNMILFQDNQPPILATPLTYLSIWLQQIYKRHLMCCSTQCQLSYKIQRHQFLRQTPLTSQSPKIKLLIWNHRMSPAGQILQPFLPTLKKLIHDRSFHFLSNSKIRLSWTFCFGSNWKTSVISFFCSNSITSKYLKRTMA